MSEADAAAVHTHPAEVRGLLRFFAGTVVLEHNAQFSSWRRLASKRDTTSSMLLEVQMFLQEESGHIIDMCRTVGCAMPADFAGLSKLSSIPMGSETEHKLLCARFRDDHRQMVDDARFLLAVAPVIELSSYTDVMNAQIEAHHAWSTRWDAAADDSEHPLV
ncbi:MAG: hypothetical protein AAF919_08895 [Pseudomonadota bacterium]